MGEVAVNQQAAVDPAKGTAWFTDLPAAITFAKGMHVTGEETEAVALLVRKDHHAAELRFAGPSPERSLFVALDSLGFQADEALPEALFAVDAQGRDVATLLPRAANRYVATGVEPGLYQIQVRDPRFRAVLLERHPTGLLGTASLAGSVSLDLRFVDEVDGSPVNVTSVTLCEHRRMASSSSLTTRTWAPKVHGTLTCDALIPGATVGLQVRFDTHPTLAYDAGLLDAGGTHDATIRVPRGLDVAGMVLDSRGAPISDLLVTTEGDPTLEALRPGSPFRLDPSMPLRLPSMSSGEVRIEGDHLPTMPMAPRTWRNASTDADGAVVLRGLPKTATPRVFCVFTPWHVEEIPLVPAPSGTGYEPFVVRASNSGAADVEVLLDRRSDIGGWRVELRVGAGDWLGYDEQRVVHSASIRLRGLPIEPCSMRFTPLKSKQSAASESVTVEFVPATEAATPVRVDLRGRLR